MKLGQPNGWRFSNDCGLSIEEDQGELIDCLNVLGVPWVVQPLDAVVRRADGDELV